MFTGFFPFLQYKYYYGLPIFSPDPVPVSWLPRCYYYVRALPSHAALIYILLLLMTSAYEYYYCYIEYVFVACAVVISKFMYHNYYRQCMM